MTATSSLASTVRGKVIHSASHPGVRYHLDELAREGGMGVTYFGRRQGDGGTSRVVVKVMKPELGGGLISAETVATKEVTALTRLNDRVPPTPFVVRLLDHGCSELTSGRQTSWAVIEYVHGGLEGTTLQERVAYCLNKTGYGFAPRRAAHLLHCLASGLSAVHEVNVIHRDLSPNNVLCCGFGETEIFKVSDFGIARLEGLAQTFGGVPVGTLGYSPPEAAGSKAGPHSDVFSLACVIYHALTGQHYYGARTYGEMLRKLASPSRPSVFDHVTLHPDLQHDSAAGAALDEALRAATAADTSLRPASVRDFQRAVAHCLGEQSGAPPSSSGLLAGVTQAEGEAVRALSWVVKSRPQPHVIRSAAWDADGHALALVEDGALFWNGHSWVNASDALGELRGRPEFVQRYEAGGWLIGGPESSLAVLGATGVSHTAHGPNAGQSFRAASGRLDDLLVAVGSQPGEPPSLWTYVARRWMKPFVVQGVQRVNSLQRLDDERWIVGGQARAGGAFAGIYSPLQQSLEPLDVGAAPALLIGAALPERRMALVAGGSHVLRVDQDVCACELVSEDLQISAVALDIVGDEWVGGSGSLWCRSARRPWAKVWSSETPAAPFCALLADAGVIVGMTVDGGIIEGRPEVCFAPVAAVSR